MKVLIVILSLFLTLSIEANQQPLNTEPQLKNQQNNFVTVGAGGNCDFSEIQSAIDSAPASRDIRIASDKAYFEYISLQNESQTLIGGYANCTDAANNVTDHSQAIVSSFGDGHIIHIRAANDEISNVVLRNLFVGNAERGIVIDTFGDESTINVTLDHVRTYNNNNKGIEVQSNDMGPVNVIMNDVQIDFNKIGIFCTGTGASVTFTGSSLISDNGNGNHGATLVNFGCGLTVYSPTRIINNDGPGIDLYEAQATLLGYNDGCENGICFGEWSSPVEISGNKKGFDIGESSLVMANVLIKDNQSFGLYANDSQVLAVGSGVHNDQGCWSLDACLQFKGNSTYNSAGAIYSNNSTVIVTGALITGNQSNGVLVAEVKQGSVVNISNSLITDNGQTGNDGFNDDSLFTVQSNGQLTLDYVTIANNHGSGATIINADEDAEITVRSSIILDDMRSVFTGDSTETHFECVMVDEDDSFDADGPI